jgi:hypothetical protein
MYPSDKSLLSEPIANDLSHKILDSYDQGMNP